MPVNKKESYTNQFALLDGDGVFTDKWNSWNQRIEETAHTSCIFNIKFLHLIIRKALRNNVLNWGTEPAYRYKNTCLREFDHSETAQSKTNLTEHIHYTCSNDIVKKKWSLTLRYLIGRLTYSEAKRLRRRLCNC